MSLTSSLSRGDDAHASGAPTTRDPTHTFPFREPPSLWVTAPHARFTHSDSDLSHDPDRSIPLAT